MKLKEPADIKLYILTLMLYVDYPLRYSQINDIVVQDEFVSNFDFIDQFEELKEAGFVKSTSPDMYEITETGEFIARTLKGDISGYIREKGIRHAIQLLSFEKSKTKIKTELSPGEGDTVIGGVDPNVVRVFDSMLTNGVFVAEDANALKPTAIGGLKVEMAPGTVMIEGLSRRDAKRTRIYNTSDTQRVEVFLYRLDKTTGEISYLFRDCIVHGGLIFSKEDGTDLPIRESGYYDILIWKITIPAGATEITQDMIEDLRAIEDYCGFVKLHRSLAVEEWAPAEGGTY